MLMIILMMMNWCMDLSERWEGVYVNVIYSLDLIVCSFVKFPFLLRFFMPPCMCGKAVIVSKKS